MALTFETDKTAKYRFQTTEDGSDKTTLTGINPTLASAESICAGVDSLMAIGLNTPYHIDGTRTVTQIVYDY